MAASPQDPWHRRYWAYLEWPRPGCAVLWTVLIIILIIFAFSLLFIPEIPMRASNLFRSIDFDSLQ